MEQLISITSVPMKYEMTVTKPRLEQQSQETQVNYNRQRGGLHISNQPAKLLINTINTRKSMGLISMGEATATFAQQGSQAAQNAMAQYSAEAREMVNAKPGQDVLNQIAAQRVALPSGDFTVDFIPSVGPEIQFLEQDFQMNYQTDKLQFDARVSSGRLEFIPGEVSMNVTQWPDVVIEYLGKPMYVPPSAAARFEASA